MPRTVSGPKLRMGRLVVRQTLLVLIEPPCRPPEPFWNADVLGNSDFVSAGRIKE